ncbi:MAG: deoxyribodipyrimidine photo-lyase [Microlunatus sp.]
MAWLRRDLRRADLPLLAAAYERADGGRIAVCFVLDPAIFDGAGPVRQAWLAANLLALRDSYQGRLTLLHGNPVDVLPKFAQELDAVSVHVSTETTPFGAARDARVRAALAEIGVDWVETGSPYAVTPGRVLNKTGDPFAVFTPFARAWRDHGWRAPAEEPPTLQLAEATDRAETWALLERAVAQDGLPELPPAGEEAALARWRTFLSDDLPGYAAQRDRPDLNGTSQLSPYLKLGVLHPRTLLADLADHHGAGAERWITELAWREFYADVLHHHPGSLDADLRNGLAGMAYDEDPALIDAWQQGRTGYPFVDAGMRQLLAVGWMHNRVRMVTASFLTKDLHVWWPIGARWFLDHLVDGDLASNTHGWQWVAGTGTDATPYFRVFNPVLQGLKFDPDGNDVRRWIPELQHLSGAAVHEPWKHADGYARGYPERIVDHAAERHEALARYQAVRQLRRGDG